MLAARDVVLTTPSLIRLHSACRVAVADPRDASLLHIELDGTIPRRERASQNDTSGSCPMPMWPRVLGQKLRLTDPRQPQGPTHIEERAGGAVENSDELVVGHAIGCSA
jgi:hypothetical protein